MGKPPPANSIKRDYYRPKASPIYLFRVVSIRANRTGQIVSVERRAGYICEPPDDSHSEATGASAVGQEGALAKDCRTAESHGSADICQQTKQLGWGENRVGQVLRIPKENQCSEKLAK